MKGAVIIDRPVTVETAVGYKPPAGSKPVVLPPLQGGQDPTVAVSRRSGSLEAAHLKLYLAIINRILQLLTVPCLR